MRDPLSPTITVAAALENARRLLATQPEAAANQSRAIIAAEPNIAESHFLLACALRKLGQQQAATEAQQQGIGLAETDPVVVEAVVRIEAGDYQQADQLLTFYLADTPNDPVAVRYRALVRERLGDYEEAHRLLTRAAALAPGYQHAEQALAALARLVESQAQPQAEEWFTTPPADADGDK